MANDVDGPAPIIKRKKIVAGDGHHGGAWKVAYADFVTAMMAFFLLMWLLNATTERQRKGLADYFAPTIAVVPVSGGGEMVLQGDSASATDVNAHNGVGGGEGKAEIEVGELEQDGGAADQQKDLLLNDIESELVGLTGESEVADELLSHIVTRVTDEGLVIDIFAKEGRPLFEVGSSQPTEIMQRILAMISGVIAHVSNHVAVTGHTDGRPFLTAENDNWRLSADRANAVRRSLIAEEVDPARFERVTGVADRNLALPDSPEDPRNRRIALTLIRSGK